MWPDELYTEILMVALQELLCRLNSFPFSSKSMFGIDRERFN